MTPKQLIVFRMALVNYLQFAAAKRDSSEIMNRLLVLEKVVDQIVAVEVAAQIGELIKEKKGIQRKDLKN